MIGIANHYRHHPRARTACGRTLVTNETNNPKGVNCYQCQCSIAKQERERAGRARPTQHKRGGNE